MRFNSRPRVTAIFINSLWGNPRLFIEAIRSVGQPIAASSLKTA